MTPTTIPSLQERRQPGLSQTLPFPRRLDTCQACGTIANALSEPHRTWRECDEWDQPTRVAVVLCARCSKQLIDPHPRLYISIDRNEPIAGVMELCVGCQHQTALTCLHPNLKANGGPGLEVKFPEPIRALVRGRGVCGPMTIWKGPPTECAGREVAS